jgi:peroxiredoxin
VILAFYPPADWSPVCGDQVTLSTKYTTQKVLVGISVDGVWRHAAFARDRRLHFPLLADFEPKREVATKYRAYRASDGVCERALFALDRQGTIALRLRSIPARMKFLTLSKTSQIRQAAMATLKAPLTQNDHIRGPAQAPITLVEYGDYECPHCALAHPIVNQVQLSFSDRMGFVFRHFPLTEVHPHAGIAAESAEFAGAAGLFWDTHDALFENQSRLSVTMIFLIGAELGLPATAMRNALATGEYKISAQRFHGRHTQRREWHTGLFH